MSGGTATTDGGGWQFWIDRGGTFTDVVARRPDGGLVTHKLLSDNPEHYRDAAIQGIREVLGIAPGEPVRGGRRGQDGDDGRHQRAPRAQGRPYPPRRQPGVPGRAPDRVPDAASPLRPSHRASRDALRAGGRGRCAGGGRRRGDCAPGPRAGGGRSFGPPSRTGSGSVAIVLMHGYRYPDHELALARLAREIGFTQVSTSYETSPLMKLVGRGDTTVVDAYLSPLLRRYIDQVAGELGEGVRLMFMQSNGGLTDARRFQGKDAILSGPAGGIVGAVETAARAGRARIISFDMGGTSTDVAHYDGAYERAFETLVAGVRMRAPMMMIHTVAAGGGSILSFDGARLPGGPGVGGRRSGAGLLPAGRAALRHRLQRPPRQAPARVLSARLRPRPGPAPRPRCGGGRVRGARGGYRGEPGGGGPARAVRGRGRRGVPSHRGRQHGERDQVHLGPPRLRRDRVHPELLRRGGRTARLPRRGRARHDPGHDPPLRGRALGLRDGARRRAGAPGPGGGGPPRRCGGGGAWPVPGRPRGRDPRGARGPGDRGGADPGAPARPRPLPTGRTPRTSWTRGPRAR